MAQDNARLQIDDCYWYKSEPRLQLVQEDSFFSASTAQHSTVWHTYCEATLRNLSNGCGHNQRVVCCNDTIGIDARAGLLIRLQQGTTPASD